jgi:hypothetical protein
MFEFCKQLLIVGFSLALVGCGGGGGGGGDGGSSATPPINVNGGVFSSMLNGAETVTVLASDALIANSAIPNWFGYQFSTVSNTTSLNFYSARVTGVGSGQASGSAFKHFQGQGTPMAGTLTLSTPLSNRLSSQLVMSNPLENLIWLNDALPLNQYNASATAPVINGNWTGNWYYGVSSSGRTVGLNAGDISGQNVFTNCDFDQGSQLTPLNGANLYSVNLWIKVHTLCSIPNPSNTQSAQYQGLAYVANTSNGVELVIMAVSSDHKALFFQGYR